MSKFLIHQKKEYSSRRSSSKVYMSKLLAHQERSIIRSSSKPKGNAHQTRSTWKTSQEGKIIEKNKKREKRSKRGILRKFY